MASIHVYVDTCDRQWANPPNMIGLYHAHMDTSELALSHTAIEAISKILARQLLTAIMLADAEELKSNPPQYEVYDNANGGMRLLSNVPHKVRG